MNSPPYSSQEFQTALGCLTLGSGAALLPSNSREAVWISQYHWFSCHWLRSGTEGKFRGYGWLRSWGPWGERENREVSASVSCVHPCLRSCPYWSALTNAHFRLCGIRYQRNTRRASKLHHSKTPKLWNEWSNRLDRTEKLQHNKKKKKLKLNPVFLAAVNWANVTVLCTQLKQGLKTTPQHELLSDSSENLQHLGVNF